MQPCGLSRDEYGCGVPQNYQEALRLYTLASERGYVDALKDIGRVQAIMRDDPNQALSKPKTKRPKPNQACSCRRPGRRDPAMGGAGEEE